MKVDLTCLGNVFIHVHTTLVSPGRAVFSGLSTQTLTLKRIDGSSFNLKSVDIQNLNEEKPSQVCTITGTLSGGGAVSHTFTTDALSTTYETYVLPSTFSNLISVELGNGLVVTTNVVLS